MPLGSVSFHCRQQGTYGGRTPCVINSSKLAVTSIAARITWRDLPGLPPLFVLQATKAGRGGLGTRLRLASFAIRERLAWEQSSKFGTRPVSARALCLRNGKCDFLSTTLAASWAGYVVTCGLLQLQRSSYNILLQERELEPCHPIKL